MNQYFPEHDITYVSIILTASKGCVCKLVSNFSDELCPVMNARIREV